MTTARRRVDDELFQCAARWHRRQGSIPQRNWLAWWWLRALARRRP